MIYNVFGCAVHSKLRSSVKEEAKPNMFMVAIFYSYLNSNTFEESETETESCDDSVKTKTTTMSPLLYCRWWWCRCKRMAFSLALSGFGVRNEIVLAETAQIIIIKCNSNETNGMSYMNIGVLGTCRWCAFTQHCQVDSLLPTIKTLTF